jgi:threonine 3-dehydrogenase
MRALVKKKPNEKEEWKQGFELVNRPEPTIQLSTDVIIKVRSAAICGTDVGIYYGKESIKKEMLKAKVDEITVGHEFCGRIVDAGPEAKKHIAKLVFAKAKNNDALKSALKGKTVGTLAGDKKLVELLAKKFFATAEMHVVCGYCTQCKRGEYHVCRNTIINGLHDHGAFAEYVRVPASNIRLYFGNEIHPDIISFMDALGNATHTVLSVPVKDNVVAVLGCGIQGLMAVAVAKYAGAKRIYVTDASHGDYSHEKLVSGRFKLAAAYGADHCFDVSLEVEHQDLFDTINRETDTNGVDAVYEMSGNYRAYEDADRILRMGGHISLLGIPSGTMAVDFAKSIIFKGVSIHGIIGRKMFQTWDQMEHLLRAGLMKKFLKTDFVSHRFTLEECDAAFQTIKNGDAYKVLFVP